LSLRRRDTRSRVRAYEGLQRRGVVTDWREPAVIRAALAPFYNGYEDAQGRRRSRRSSHDGADARMNPHVTILGAGPRAR
jgi:hypothetical protein